MRHALAVDGRNVNNLLCYPGLFKGAVAAGAKSISQAMKLAAVEVIANAATEGEILPEPLNKAVHHAVARAVREAAVSELPQSMPSRSTCSAAF